MKRLVSVGVGLIILLCLMTVVLPLAFPGRIPPAEITRSRMVFDRKRILDYAREHNQLPPDLSALPRSALKPEADHYFEDGWQRKITYQTDPSGVVTLKSLGKDGVAGGSGDDADIVFSFPSHRPDGGWSEASDIYDSPR